MTIFVPAPETVVMPDDAERAVRAGLALVEAVPKLDDQRGTALQARVGIATGLVVVSDVLGEGAAQEQAASWRDASGALRQPVGSSEPAVTPGWPSRQKAHQVAVIAAVGGTPSAFRCQGCDLDNSDRV
jgi:hypothetical protein